MPLSKSHYYSPQLETASHSMSLMLGRLNTALYASVSSQTAQSLTLQSLEPPLSNSSSILLRGRGPIVRPLPLRHADSSRSLARSYLNTTTAVNSLGPHTKFLSLKLECMVNLNNSLNFPQRLEGFALVFQIRFLENIPLMLPLLLITSFNSYHDALICSYL